MKLKHTWFRKGKKMETYLYMSTAEIYRNFLDGISIKITHFYRYFNVLSFTFHIPKRRNIIISSQVSCSLINQLDIAREAL